jgi:uncharacterized protein
VIEGDSKRFLKMLFDKLQWSEDERRQALEKIAKNLEVPVRIIGIGQCGVGKTELLKSIFRISENDLKVLKKLRTGATKATTKTFYSFVIQTKDGFKVEFTDGPGLGEDLERDEEYIQAWIKEIPGHDILYWVMDAASRDIRHIQQNMKRILDETGYRNRFVLVLNKIDQIELEEEDRVKGSVGWHEKFNVPTKKLLKQIELRTNDIIAKFEKYADVDRNHVVACSALKRWQHDVVLDKMLEFLPPEKRIKVAQNRDVKSPIELMAPDVRRRLEAEGETAGYQT